MHNLIRKTTIEIQRLSAAEAEVWVSAELEELTPSTELRGKFTGPRCPGVTTVEVAYPLRPLPRLPASPPATLTVRALIPEPSLWTETTPFLYTGRLELWQDGACADVVKLVVGLKQSA